MRANKYFSGLAVAVAGLLGITATAAVAQESELPDGFEFDGSVVSLWSPSDMRAIDMQADNRMPLMLPPEQILDDTVFMWDSWPLRTWDGEIADLDGWKVLVGLSAERTTEGAPAFYTRSEWRYWFTKDGDWKPGGLVFDPADAFGSRQWAGSAKYDPETETASFYYTAVGGDPTQAAEQLPASFPQGDPAAGRPPVDQTIAVVETSVEVDDEGVRFTDFGEHRRNPPGRRRDLPDDRRRRHRRGDLRLPRPVGLRRSRQRRPLSCCSPPTPDSTPAHRTAWSASPAKVTTASGRWRSPIVAAPGVSSQLERPHLVWRDDGAYLFWSTHSFTFAEQGAGPEGLYGMVAPSGDWKGQYVPLNRGGLVAGNPEAAPTQTYSYLVLPSGHVMSYLNTAGTPGGEPRRRQLGGRCRRPCSRSRWTAPPPPLPSTASRRPRRCVPWTRRLRTRPANRPGRGAVAPAMTSSRRVRRRRADVSDRIDHSSPGRRGDGLRDGRRRLQRRRRRR